MALYETKDRVVHGVPLGGIGAGKFELNPAGLFNAFTFRNNWSDPLSGAKDYPGVLGYHLGVSVENPGEGPSRRKARLLQTARVLDLPRVKNIRYDGVFPRVTLTYEDPSLGLAVSLEALSTLVPGDEK